MANKTKTVRLTLEEIELLNKFRQGTTEEAPAEAADPSVEAHKALADAFVSAIERTKSPEKKTVFTRKKKTPWTPPPGTPDVKLKRKMYQHGLEINPNRVTVDVKELLNKIKPGVYCDGWVQVQLRKDRGINITYPMKTNAQRLKLVNKGIRNFKELLERLIDEKTNPTKYRTALDADLYENE